MNIHERIEEQVDLAKCYAEDGAFASAARVLRGLAQEVQAHAEAVKVTEYDNRAFGGSVGFYTKRGKVILNFKRKVISVYRRNRKKGWQYDGEWSLVKEWELNR